MADISPFHGVHYNPALVKDTASVICPPYDVISPDLQRELYEKNARNFVRIEYGRENPADSDSENRYTRAASTMSSWISDGTLKEDNNPSIYIDDHYFNLNGKEYRRRNLFCLVRLEEWEKGIVLPHEATAPRAKGDRLNLLRTLRANTSPIMALYDDPLGRISALLEWAATVPPILSTSGSGEEGHDLWGIRNPEIISGISQILAQGSLYIADGHHRYESALAYRNERRAAAGNNSPDRPYDFVMMTLVSFSDPGLVVLPAHRVFRGLSASKISGLVSGLENKFSITEHRVDGQETVSIVEGLLSAEGGGARVALFGLIPGIIHVITPRDSNLARELDVALVDHVITSELLGLGPDESGDYLAYTSDTSGAIKDVAEGRAQFVAFVRPIRPVVIKEMADSGILMPRKSTYFYPKIPAGLVVYRLS